MSAEGRLDTGARAISTGAAAMPDAGAEYRSSIASRTAAAATLRMIGFSSR
jgi:hypothetical protein